VPSQIVGAVCLPLLIFPCTIKSISSLLAPAHLGGPGKKAIKWLCVCVLGYLYEVLVASLVVTKQCWVSHFGGMAQNQP